MLVDNKYWYKNAVIYGIDVETFKDGNGDGIGDFKGLTEKLSYLKNLGINCIWLLPFYPSPNKDNGYDVKDYINIDPKFGTLEEFKKLIKAANKLNIRVIIDLVLHHTSDEHPWFQAARNNKHSKYYEYYIWTQNPPDDPSDKPAFPGEDDNVWEYDPVAKEYYHHLFYKFQPDLNIGNPDVKAEVQAVIDFWLAFGVSGFRVDAAPHMISSKGLKGTAVKEKAKYFESLNKYIKKINKEAVLFGETDIMPEEANRFFGDGKRINLLLNFPVNIRLMLALATKSNKVLIKGLNDLVSPTEKSQWINFMRNLDELNIEKLPPSQREKIYKEFAPEKNMQIYGRGIRRRMAPMVNNIQRLKMAYSILFTLPGAPLIVYGDEIGMGEDLSLPGRISVRTPMQWDSTENAGFSDAPADKIYPPVISNEEYSYKKVNVELQLKEPGSLLNMIKRMIEVKKDCPEIGWWDFEILDLNDDRVLALTHQWKRKRLLTIHNLSDEAIDIKLEGYGKKYCEQIYGDVEGCITEDDCLELNPYGFHWFKIKSRKGD